VCFSLLGWHYFHRERIATEFLQAEKLRLGLATSLDLVRFAAKLTEDIFLDWKPFRIGSRVACQIGVFVSGG